jgi:hypothetical protein
MSSGKYSEGISTRARPCGAIGLVGGYGEGLEFAYGHARGGLLESLDYLARTDGECEWFSSDGCVELKPVFEPPPVVNPDLVALRRFC